MRLGVMADVHGNDVALRAVLDDAANRRVDRWWVLGDLVLLGPRPAEVLELLRPFPGVGLVERYGLMAAGIGRTRGVLGQAGLLETLVGLPGELRLRLPGGTRVLGVHASPGSDDGPAGFSLISVTACSILAILRTASSTG
jgi:hypothetical protein